MDRDEQIVEYFLNQNGLDVERFMEAEKSFSKTPDFRVIKDSELVAFCEVKSVLPDDWLDKKLADAPPGVRAGGLRKDPTFNNLSNKIHEAVKQFDAVNPDLKYPNILVFLNHEKDRSFNDLYGVVTGKFISTGGYQHTIYRRFSEGRIKDEKFRVHLYLWIEKEKDEFYLFNEISSTIHFEKLCSFFGKNPNEIGR